METLKSAVTLFTPQRFSNHNYRFLAKSPFSVKLHSSLFSHDQKLQLSSSKTPIFCFALQDVAPSPIQEETTETLNNLKKKLCVFNLPWSLSVPDIKHLFAQCGTVIDVEIIKSKDGKGRGYAFVTMDSGEEAKAAVDKFDAYVISGRIIRVEFAKRFKKPPPPPSRPSPPPSEARYVIYASNLAWKARSTHLRDVFTENFKSPVSARVVFESPAGRSAGYGFVSYHTMEEAEAAIAALEGKELMGRPLRVKLSEKKVKEAGSEESEDQDDDAQQEESNSI